MKERIGPSPLGEWMDTRATLEFLSSLQDETSRSLPANEEMHSTSGALTAEPTSVSSAEVMSVGSSPVVPPAAIPPVKAEYRNALQDPKLLRALMQIASPHTTAVKSSHRGTVSMETGTASSPRPGMTPPAASRPTPARAGDFATGSVESVSATPKIDERTKWQRRDTQRILRTSREE